MYKSGQQEGLIKGKRETKLGGVLILIFMSLGRFKTARGENNHDHKIFGHGKVVGCLDGKVIRSSGVERRAITTR